MHAPGIPSIEPERLDALRRLNMLDTAPEERFDRITRIARSYFKVPMALISLVDSNRQWFKSRQGLAVAETPRDVSFCGHTILGDAILYVPDALGDVRFTTNPLVTGPPGLRCYLGAPLTTRAGLRIGTLCLADIVPRRFVEEDFCVLRDLAGCAARELERDQALDVSVSLAAQESRLRAVLNTVVDGIVTIDAGGGIESLNPAAERIFGYTAAEVIGQNVKMLMPAPYRQEHDGYLGNYMRSGEAKIIGIGREVTGLRKDGSQFPMELAVSEMAVGGQRMFTGIVRDITERKRADVMKREFVSTVSHELRTPLTSIKGSLGLIQSGAIGELPERLKLMLNIAYSNSDRLIRLINYILDIEKIEAGKMDFLFGSLNLGTLLDQAIEANKELGVERGVRFVRADAVSVAPIQGDQDRLMQVFANLLSNAVKFSSRNGVVTLSMQDLGDHVRIDVSDHGSGIPEEFRDKVFDKFAQADSSDTRARGGTGLGLSVTKAIVERHGGKIGFTTRLGAGTTFSFTLPAGGGRDASPPSLVEDSHPRRILVCEDEVNLARLLQLILGQDGYTIDVAHDAASAEQKLKEHSYDAMTLDLCLPDKDGISLLRGIRANPATRDLPVIVVSVAAEDGHTDLQGDGIGTLDWIQKPIHQDRLLASLRRAVRPRRAGVCRILHVEDDPDILAIVSAVVGDLAEIVPAINLTMAGAELEKQKFDLVILDMSLPDGEGEGLLPVIRGSMNRNTPVIVFSAREISAETAQTANMALIKSRTTNNDLLALIRAVMDMPEPALSC